MKNLRVYMEENQAIDQDGFYIQEKFKSCDWELASSDIPGYLCFRSSQNVAYIRGEKVVAIIGRIGMEDNAY